MVNEEKECNQIRWIAEDRRKEWCSKTDVSAKIEHVVPKMDLAKRIFQNTSAKGILTKKHKAKNSNIGNSDN